MVPVRSSSKPSPSRREDLEYLAARGFLFGLGIVSRRTARFVGGCIGLLSWALLPRLRRVGLRNLALALPEHAAGEHRRILRASFVSQGRQLAEFAQMRRYTATQAQEFIRYEGLERFLAAHAAGRGVLVLTAHLGAWELSSFFHSLMGYPMGLVIRRLDNARVDKLVNGIRTLHGNRVLHKDDFARGLLKAMHSGEAVGILMDTNMTPPQGVFVPFFGTEACTASGLARVALHSGAAVLPGFLLWERAEGRYVLHFGPELTLQRSGDAERDALANTALFTRTLEDYIRRYPEQWLWVHRRWKTRPPGQSSLYA